VEKRNSIAILVLTAALLGGASSSALGHAFLDHAEPGVGEVLSGAPQKIVLYFDSALELAFSGFLIVDADGREVARSGAQNEAEPTQLSLNPPPLRPGTYKVFWSVVARDGHQTEGDFTFTVQ
jgi:methionine-rich copper-binding protein CopC